MSHVAGERKPTSARSVENATPTSPIATRPVNHGATGVPTQRLTLNAVMASIVAMSAGTGAYTSTSAAATTPAGSESHAGSRSATVDRQPAAGWSVMVAEQPAPRKRA